MRCSTSRWQWRRPWMPRAAHDRRRHQGPHALKVAVIGAGIVGVTTAYELAADGHEVTVFERHGAVAEETSFANAGVVAPGYVTPWAAPGMPAKVLRHLVRNHAPVRISWPLSAAEMRWMWQWRQACRLDTYLAN